MIIHFGATELTIKHEELNTVYRYDSDETWDIATKMVVDAFSKMKKKVRKRRKHKK